MPIPKYLSEWFSWVTTNPILLTAIIPFIGALILPFLSQLSPASLAESGLIIMASTIVYQYYNCKIKIENIMKKRIEKGLELLSTRLAKGEISPDEYKERKEALTKTN